MGVLGHGWVERRRRATRSSAAVGGLNGRGRGRRVMETVGVGSVGVGPCRSLQEPWPIGSLENVKPGHASHHVLSQQGAPSLGGLEEGQEGARLGDKGLVSPASALRQRMTWVKTPLADSPWEKQEGKGLGQVTPVSLPVAAPGRPQVLRPPCRASVGTEGGQPEGP